VSRFDTGAVEKFLDVPDHAIGVERR